MYRTQSQHAVHGGTRQRRRDGAGRALVLRRGRDRHVLRHVPAARESGRGASASHGAVSAAWRRGARGEGIHAGSAQPHDASTSKSRTLGWPMRRWRWWWMRMCAIVAERSMYWPGPSGDGWIEAHNSAGATETGTAWTVAGGEQGGAFQAQTYVLIANTSSFTGTARVTVLREGGTPLIREFDALRRQPHQRRHRRIPRIRRRRSTAASASSSKASATARRRPPRSSSSARRIRTMPPAPSGAPAATRSRPVFAKSQNERVGKGDSPSKIFKPLSLEGEGFGVREALSGPPIGSPGGVGSGFTRLNVASGRFRKRVMSALSAIAMRVRRAIEACCRASRASWRTH